MEACAEMPADARMPHDMDQEALTVAHSKNRCLGSVNSPEAYLKRAITTKCLERVREERAERLRTECTAPTRNGRSQIRARLGAS